MYFEGFVYRRLLCQVQKLNLTYAYTRLIPLGNRNGTSRVPYYKKTP